MLLPDPLPCLSVPGVLALHQTTILGKAEPCGLAGDPEMHYGLELARRGYVVLAPDSITMGERVTEGAPPTDTDGYYRSGPRTSAVGRMVTDHRQALSVLAALPMVTPDTIGVVGHSLGGYSALFLAGTDERVAAAVCSCGFGMFGADPQPGRWSRDGFDHIPRLRDDLATGRVPWEWHEILALVAPRPVHVYGDAADEVFPNAPAIRAGLAQVAELYERLGVPGHFESTSARVGHHFPAEARQRVYTFLDRVLRAPAPPRHHRPGNAPTTS